MRSAVYSSLILAIGALTPAQSQAQAVWNALPGEFAIQTANGDYVSATPYFEPPGDSPDDFDVTTDQLGIDLFWGWQKFRLAQRSPSAPQDKSIQTNYGRYLTAVDGGGRTSGRGWRSRLRQFGYHQIRVYGKCRQRLDIGLAQI
jgi:hypothetical protein